MKKKWELYEEKEDEVKKLQDEYKLNYLLAKILVNKGITEKEQIRKFLNPTRNDFYDPFLMPDMEKAVERILTAIEKNEKTIIYGDYDVDGITSITVLKSFLKERGLDVDYYIPNRLKEGYGLNKEAVKKIADDGYKLMITVDCGISCKEEIDYANELGIETIVTDHHEVGTEIPTAVAVVDAKRKDSNYPFRELAGVGVVFKLTQALSNKLNLEEKEYLKNLDIVCVGTISDIVPLIDENRVIAKLGLLLVEQTKNLGLKAILTLAGYKKIDSSAISFGVAPRINACGRMGDAYKALELLLSKNLHEIDTLTKQLNAYNAKRQEIEKTIFEEAMEQIKEQELDKNRTIVVAGKDWHHGVIGIVSSKVTEQYFKPSILLSYEDDFAKGSGRSIPGFDLYNALQKCKNSISRYGGHAMAIGITLDKNKVKEFTEQFEKVAEEEKIENIMPVIPIDAKIELEQVNREMVKSLEQLEPYGEANKTPIFLIKNLRIDAIRTLSEGKHLKLALRSNNTIIDAIGFNLGYMADDYIIGDKIDVAGSLEINSYGGMDSLQINLRDIMRGLK